MSDDDRRGPYKRDGETVDATDADDQGTITFGSSEEYDKPYKDKNWLFHQYIISKRSTPEIAEMVGCSHKTICNWLKKHGIPTRSLSESIKVRYHGSNRPWEDEEWLRDQYVTQKKTTVEIATEQGTDPSTISQEIKESDIDLRGGGQPNRHVLEPRLADTEWLREQYIERRRSAADIATGLNVSKSAVLEELRDSGIGTRSKPEGTRLRFEHENSVSKSTVPDPSESGSGDSRGGNGERTQSHTGNRSYEGPETGIDLSWSNASDTDREHWVPYRNKEWLRWQYVELDKSTYEMADVCGVSQRTIGRYMDRFGIDRRAPGPGPEDGGGAGDA